MRELLELPEEILLNVLLSLPSHRDILCCSQTCKRFCALVGASSAVQYRIQLGRCGMVEGSDATALRLSSDERSKLLRETIHKRRTFEPKFIHDLGMVEAQYERAFDLLDDIYVRLTHEPPDFSTPADGDYVARLIIKDISGECREPAKVTQLDVFPTDVAIAPSLDLIVLLVGEEETSSDGPFLRLYLRTLSSGALQEHPDAKKTILRFPDRVRPNALLEPEFHLSIDGDILALYVSDSALEVFRWTTGHHVVSWGHKIEQAVTLTAFTLISPTCFVIGQTGQLYAGCIAVYRLPNGDEPDDKQMQLGDPHVELFLPHFYREQHTVVTGMFTSPPRALKGVFENASRITVLQAAVEEVDTENFAAEGDFKELTYAFRRNFFAEAYNSYLHESRKVSAAAQVKWDDWGPPNSRLLDLVINPLPDNSVCSGSRLIYRRLIDDWESIMSESDESMACPFYYLDFGDVHDSAFLGAAQQEEALAGLQALRVMAPSDNQLVHNVRTSLPYYAIETRRETFNWSTVLIDGNRMICSRPADGTTSWDLEDGRSLEHVYEL